MKLYEQIKKLEDEIEQLKKEKEANSQILKNVFPKIEAGGIYRNDLGAIFILSVETYYDIATHTDKPRKWIRVYISHDRRYDCHILPVGYDYVSVEEWLFNDRYRYVGHISTYISSTITKPAKEIL